MRFGIVRTPYIEVVWTLPAPVGAYLSSGADVKALLLQLINLAIALVIWWPFVRRYDKELSSADAKPVGFAPGTGNVSDESPPSRRAAK